MGRPAAAAGKSKKDLVMIFRKLDKDGSEAVGFEEFCAWMAKEHCERMPDDGKGGGQAEERGKRSEGRPRQQSKQRAKQLVKASPRMAPGKRHAFGERPQHPQPCLPAALAMP